MSTAPESVRSEVGPGTPAPRRLYRSSGDRMLGGVCGGLGEYFAVDPIWFRIGFVFLTVAGGSGVLIYLLMWLVLPPTPSGYTPPAPGRGRVAGSSVIGAGLMVIGTVALVNSAAPWLGQYIWPIVLVVGGLALLIGGLTRDTH